MADPATLATIGIGGSALGGATGALGSIFGGEASKGMYDYQARVAQINANIAKQNQEYALNQGGQQAIQAGLAGAQRSGAIKSAQASSGLDVNTGSNVQVQQSQKYATSLDLDQIRSNAAKTAYNYDVEATQYENQAKLDVSAGANAETAGFIGATSSILGGASSVASKWLQFSQVSGSGILPQSGEFSGMGI